MPKLVIGDSAVSNHDKVLAKWCDYQNSSLGGLEIVVQK